MKKGAIILLTLVLTLGLLAGCGSGGNGGGDGEIKSIGIIQLAEHVALDSANEGFVDALKDEGFIDGENITIDQQNAQGDQANLNTISQRFISNECDLILAIATPAAQAVAGATEDIPILVTAVTDLVEAKLVESYEAPGTNVTGTTDMTPIEAQIDLLLELVPEAKTIGLVYNPGEVNSQIQIDIAKAYIESLGLTCEEASANTTNDVAQAMQTICAKADAVYLPTDNVFATALATVGEIGRETKTPIIVADTNMVEGGALASEGLNYYNLGYQTGLMAAKILRGEAEPATMPVEKLQETDLIINKATADILGIEIPQALLDRALTVIEE